jgi:predicted nucleic acid-binding protein
VDTSWLVAITFGEPGGSEAAELLTHFDALVASPLLEAEFLATLRREGVPLSDAPDPGFAWVTPDRSLRPEVERVLDVGYIRGADLWHLATALFVAPDTEQLSFLTFDQRQREVAAALGFQAPTPA